MSGNLASIPRELRDRTQWVCWKLKKRNGEFTKIPVKARNPHDSARSNDPKTWGRFETAASKLKPPWTTLDGVAGVGYVFAPDDGFCGIDFDGCLVDGELAEWARPWLDRLAGSYMEISPSGKGVKVWCRATLPGSGGKRALEGAHTGVEVYDKGRFFCVTGDVYGEAPAEIADHQGVVDELYRWVKERPAKAAPPPPIDPKPFAATASSGEWTAEDRAIAYLATIEGAVSGQGGHDATFRAACKVVEFGITDLDRVHQILRDHYNGRCQPPWEDRELRHKAESAIENAEAGKKLKKDRPAPATGSVGKPAREIDVRLAKKMRTDMGNGERLAARTAGKLRYCKPWGEWLSWDGKRYARDMRNESQKAAKKAIRMILSEAATIADDDDRKRHVEHALSSQGRSRVDAMLAMAASEPGIPIVPDEMNMDPWLFNCANGTIDLKTGRLKAHDPADVLTQLCPVDFDPNATCPLWDATLDLFFAGDQKLIAYWQRVCGYALVGLVRDHTMPVAYGDGSNGKSTILGTLIDVLGPDYAMKAPPNLLMAKAQEQHPTDRADLFGKRLVVAIETAEGRRLDETLVKELTGGDKIRARRMREDFWEFSPTHTLLMATNHKPVIKGTDNGIWRRLKLVPFAVKVEGAKEDKSMPEKLRAEFPGILAWCVRGCLAWQEIGLQEPDVVVRATAEYRSEQDVIGAFLEERTIQAEGTRSRCNEVYNAYKAWAEDAGERIVSLRAFGDVMRERGVQTKTSNGKWYIGVGLKQGDPTFGVVA